MSDSTIIASFQNAFPGLYSPSVAPPSSVSASLPTSVSASVAPGSASVGATPAAKVAGAEGQELVEGEAKQPDQYSVRIQAITDQFELTRGSAGALEQYLQAAQEEAREAEARCLADADAEFTPAWRDAGLPMKPSHLRLDPGRMEGGRLVNPTTIISAYNQRVQPGGQGRAGQGRDGGGRLVNPTTIISAYNQVGRAGQGRAGMEGGRLVNPTTIISTYNQVGRAGQGRDGGGPLVNPTTIISAYNQVGRAGQGRAGMEGGRLVNPTTIISAYNQVGRAGQGRAGMEGGRLVNPTTIISTYNQVGRAGQGRAGMEGGRLVNPTTIISAYNQRVQPGGQGRAGQGRDGGGRLVNPTTIISTYNQVGRAGQGRAGMEGGRLVNPTTIISAYNQVGRAGQGRDGGGRLVNPTTIISAYNQVGRAGQGRAGMEGGRLVNPTTIISAYNQVGRAGQGRAGMEGGRLVNPTTIISAYNQRVQPGGQGRAGQGRDGGGRLVNPTTIISAYNQVGRAGQGRDGGGRLVNPTTIISTYNQVGRAGQGRDGGGRLVNPTTIISAYNQVGRAGQGRDGGGRLVNPTTIISAYNQVGRAGQGRAGMEGGRLVNPTTIISAYNQHVQPGGQGGAGQGRDGGGRLVNPTTIISAYNQVGRAGQGRAGMEGGRLVNPTTIISAYNQVGRAGQGRAGMEGGRLVNPTTIISAYNQVGRAGQGRAGMEGGRLVNPTTIISAYNQIKRKEVLQPPQVFEYNDTSVEPHHLRTTQGLQVRSQSLSAGTLARVREASLAQRTWHKLSAEEVRGKMAEAEERRRALAVKMPAAQFDLEKQIIKGMHHKLAFVRNPRYALPPAVKMVQSQYQEGHRWNVPDTGTKPAPPIKSNLSSGSEYFIVEPREVVFTDYEVGGVYSMRVRLRNVTAVLRPLRVFPPASQYFHISLPRFPGVEGLVAPGMAAELTLRFCPDSLADYDDSFTLDTAGSRVSIPMLGRRPPPSLSLPQDIDLGEVLVGNQRVTHIPFVNGGGPGCFRIIPESLWPPTGDAGAHALDMDAATVGPFRIWPLFLELAAGEAADLGVAFSPQAMGPYEERFIIVCDNCQVKGFTVRGLASNVVVELAQIEDRLPHERDGLLWFGEVTPGSKFTRRVSMRNTTTLSFPFQWSVSSNPQTRAGINHNATFTNPLAQHSIADEQDLTRAGSAALREMTSSPDLSYSKPALDPDPVALGSEPELTFRIEPSNGVLQPGETLEFAVTFTPHDCCRYECWAQLKVDRTVPGRPPAGCDVTVQEIGCEGLGSPLDLDVSPPLWVIPGSLTPGERRETPLQLANSSRAPAHFHVEGCDGEVLTVHPSSGIVPPLGSLTLTVSLSAPHEVGEFRRRIQINVRHGKSTCIQVHAKLVHPRVELVSTRLNFGLVRLLDVGTQELRIRNTSRTCSAPWVVSEINGHAPVPSRASTAESAFRSLVTHGSMTDPTRGGSGLSRPGSGGGGAVPGSRSARASSGGVLRKSTGEAGVAGLLASSRRRSAGLRAGFSPAFDDPAGAAEPPLPAAGGCSDPQDPAAAGGRASGRPTDADPALRLSLNSRGSSRLSGGDQRVSGAGGVPAVDPSPSRGGAGSYALPPLASGSETSGGLGGLKEEGPWASMTHLTFEPEMGLLGPGEEAVIRVCVHALSDGQHRSIIRLQSPGGACEAVEAFACVVTPHCVISTPRVDLGTTYCGVVVKHSVQLRNLSLLPVEFRWSVESSEEEVLADIRLKPDKGTLGPGEEIEIQLRYAPKSAGLSVVYGICEVTGAPQPTGFMLSSDIKGLEVTYDLLTAAQFDAHNALLAESKASGRRRRDDYEQYSGRTHLPPDITARINAHKSPLVTNRHLEANFGAAVPLGETRQMYLVVSNRTAMHTSVRSWMDVFGLEDVSRFTRKGTRTTMSRGARGTAPSPSDTHIRISRFTPIKLSGNTEKGSPFRAAEGNEMMATRRLQVSHGSASRALGTCHPGGHDDSNQNPTCTCPSSRQGRAGVPASGFQVHGVRPSDPSQPPVVRRLTTAHHDDVLLLPQEEAELALGSKGLAVSVAPPESTLEPWGRLVMAVSCFNDMCGDYVDMLHIRVGDLPAKNIPVRVGVAGTPLVVQRERTLTKGLRERSWRTHIEYGQLPQGTAVERPFYVFNTGSLDMHLSWVFHRLQDDSDCSNPLAQLLDVKILPTGAAQETDTRKPLALPSPPPHPTSAHDPLPHGHAAGGAVVVGPPPEPVADPEGSAVLRQPGGGRDQGGGSMRFCVRFRSGRAALHSGYLEGVQSVFSPEGDVKLNLWPTGERGESVRALITGTFHPFAGAPPAPLQSLRVELRAASVAARLEPDANEELAWGLESTLPEGHPRHTRTVSLSNTATCPLIFGLDVLGEGFALASATPSVPQDAILYQGTKGVPSGTDNLGGFMYLPPREIVDVRLVFKPPKPNERVHRADIAMAGDLRVTYQNGDVQLLPLKAHILHPELNVSPEALSFGLVHVQAPKPMDVTLSNPTDVDATWAVTVDGVKPRFIPPSELAASATSEARFGPWVVRPSCGVLRGRGLRMPLKQRVSVTFAPVDSSQVLQRLVFAVQKGRPCALDVHGVGSHDEREEHLTKLFTM
ncbi:MAG: hypothetical protein WDW36_003924 [Sanguina aurantia]